MNFTKSVFAGAMIAAVAGMAQAAPSTVWVNNASSTAPVIQNFDIATGALLKTVNTSNGNNGRGVVTVGNTLYYTSASTNNLFAYDLSTNTDLGSVFTVAGTGALSTIAYDGKSFYFGDYSNHNPGNVYVYSLTGTLQNTLTLANCHGNCDGLEYANGFLISNRDDTGNVYDKYDLNGNLVTAAFITSPNSASTGIAFDGTNYYTDNVYNSSFNTYNSAGQYLKTTAFAGGTLGEDLSVNYAEVPGIGTPEPAAWAMMLVGFGAIGFAARRRRFAVAA